MKTQLATTGIPVVVALIAVGVLVAWAQTEPAVELRLREPAPRPKVEAGGEQVALIGRLAKFDGHPSSLAGTWPRFRGARFDNIAEVDAPLARQWPAGGPKKLWEVELGEGHAGAAVWGGCVYVVDYDRTASSDAIRCFSLDDGREIWRFTYRVKVLRNHGMSRTVPAVNDQYLVSIGPKCHVSCLDPKSGKQYWLKDMTAEFGAEVPPWYAGQCPLIDDGKAILAPAGESLLVALDCATGAVVWRCPNPRGWTMTHVSLMPMEFGGRKMYVYCGNGGAAGIAADTGELLWDTTDWRVSIATVPSPLVLPEGKIFFCGGYNSGALMMQLRQSDGKFQIEPLFRLGPKTFGSTQHTPIFYQDHIFGVREADKQFVCLDLQGNVAWASGSRNKFGIGPYLLADGMIYILDDSGALTLIEAATDGYHRLAEAEIFPDGHDAWAPMALVDGRLLLRDVTRLACLDVAAADSAAASNAATTRRAAPPTHDLRVAVGAAVSPNPSSQP